MQTVIYRGSGYTTVYTYSTSFIFNKGGYYSSKQGTLFTEAHTDIACLLALF